MSQYEENTFVLNCAAKIKLFFEKVFFFEKKIKNRYFNRLNYLN